MRRPSLLVIGIVLIVLAIAGMVAQSLVPPSELAKKGIRTFGEVLFKDSRPDSEGRFTYTVTFVFQDASQRNHQVTRVVPDKGVWDALKTRQEVRVLYMPGRPEEASIQGAEGLARPHASAYAFLTWSAILAGAVLIVLALRSGAASGSGPGPNDDEPKSSRGKLRAVRGGRP